MIGKEDPERWRTCACKIRFEVWIDAWDVCVDLFDRDRDVLHVYHCRYGNHWHIGHPFMRNRRRHVNRLEKARRKRMVRQQVLMRTQGA